VAGYDLTFAAPKSASVLFGLADPEVAAEVLAAHHEAVASALGYVADRAVGLRRAAGGERSLSAADGVVGAAFTHGISRALDPHLHTHVVVANLAHGVDGRWSAIDSRGLFAHAGAAGQLYDAALRHRLSDALGCRWSIGQSGHYEVIGIDSEVIGTFSGRRAEIGEYVATHGSARSSRADRSLRADRVAWAATRDPKPAEVDVVALRHRWAARASDVGLDREQLAAVAGPPGPEHLGSGAPTARRLPVHAVVGARTRPPGPVIDEYRFAAALVRSPHAAATRREVMAAWAGSLAGGAPVAETTRCVDTVAAWDPAVGVAESPKALAGMVPGPHLLRALGPRPAVPEALATWQQAAADIDRYRSRWQIVDPVRPFGEDTERRSALPVRRLVDHLAVARRVDEATQLLGRAAGREAAPGLGR
jgi:conjugative relaxase-like TrwC/TraI family protein